MNINKGINLKQRDILSGRNKISWPSTAKTMTKIIISKYYKWSNFIGILTFEKL